MANMYEGDVRDGLNNGSLRPSVWSGEVKTSSGDTVKTPVSNQTWVSDGNGNLGTR